MKNFKVTKKWVMDQLRILPDEEVVKEEVSNTEITWCDRLYLNTLAAELGEPQVF